MTGFVLHFRNNVLKPLVRLTSGSNLLFVFVVLSLLVVFANAAFATVGGYCNYPDEWYKHLDCWVWNTNSGIVGAFTFFGSYAWGSFSGLFSSKRNSHRRRRPPPAGGGLYAAIKAVQKAAGSDGSEYRRQRKKIRMALPIWRLFIGICLGGLTYTGAGVIGATAGPWVLGASVLAGVLGVFSPDVLGIINKWINR